MENADVVTAHEMTGRVRQCAITELPAGFFEVAQRLWADDAIHSKTALLLECADRSINAVVECVLSLGVSQQPEAIKSCPEICDLRTAVTEAQGR